MFHKPRCPRGRREIPPVNPRKIESLGTIAKEFWERKQKTSKNAGKKRVFDSEGTKKQLNRHFSTPRVTPHGVRSAFKPCSLCTDRCFPLTVWPDQNRSAPLP